MSVQYYIAKFDDLTLYCDMRKDRSQTTSKFCLGLRSTIRGVMITSSYHVDSVKEAFHLALELELAFKGIFIFKAKEQCFKCEAYRYYDYQCPSTSRHVKIVPSDDVVDSKVVENVYILSESTSVVKDTLLDSDTLIFYEVHAFSENTSDSEHELVESSVPVQIA